MAAATVRDRQQRRPSSGRERQNQLGPLLNPSLNYDCVDRLFIVVCAQFDPSVPFRYAEEPKKNKDFNMFIVCDETDLRSRVSFIQTHKEVCHFDDGAPLLWVL